MPQNCRNSPAFLCRQIELAIDKLVVRPGSLHRRLLDMRETLLISPADFPSRTLAAEWGTIRAALAALPEFKCEMSDDAALVTAVSLLDFRNLLREWLLRNESITDEGTAA